MPEDTSRLSAALLLARLQSLRSAIESAAGRLSGTAAESRLAAILDQVAGAEGEVSQALQSGGRIPFDLAAVERLLASSEAALSTTTAAGGAEAAGKLGLDLVATSEATRREVQNLSRDLFEQRIFDPYLKFSTAEEERAYRDREADRQRQIAELLGQHTSGGDLQAGGLTAGQMLDAHDHGAGASPEFMGRWNSLVEQLHRQRTAMVAERKHPEAVAQFDRQIRRDIRSSLERRGVPAEQIERVLASDDPLRAATPYLNEEAARVLEGRLQSSTAPPLQQGTEAPAQTRTETPPRSPSEEKPVVAIAGIASIIQGVDLAAIGVTAALSNSTAAPAGTTGEGHGLAEQTRALPARPSGRTVT